MMNFGESSKNNNENETLKEIVEGKKGNNRVYWPPFVLSGKCWTRLAAFSDGREKSTVARVTTLLPSHIDDRYGQWNVM